MTSERSESLSEPGPVPAAEPPGVPPSPDAPGAPEAPGAPDVSVRAALAGQRRIVQVGSLFALAAVVVGAALSHPLVGLFVAVGVALAMVNSLATEMGMARMVASGEELSRKQFAVSALMRLAAISLVGFGLVVFFWRQGGVAVLFGLALFQMMTLVLQGIPLLKELHKI